MSKNFLVAVCLLIISPNSLWGKTLSPNPCLPCNSSNLNLGCGSQLVNGKNCTVCLGLDDTPCEKIACSPDCPTS